MQPIIVVIIKKNKIIFSKSVTNQKKHRPYKKLAIIT